MLITPNMLCYCCNIKFNTIDKHWSNVKFDGCLHSNSHSSFCFHILHFSIAYTSYSVCCVVMSHCMGNGSGTMCLGSKVIYCVCVCLRARVYVVMYMYMLLWINSVATLRAYKLLWFMNPWLNLLI